MRPRTPNISLETKRSIRRDYALGKGTIASLAKSYKIHPKTIAKWIDTENWIASRNMFSRNDDLVIAKEQLTQFDAMIAAETDSERLLQLVKCKQGLFEIFATIAGLPRRPIGKLPKEKSNKFAELMEAASKSSQDEDHPKDGSVEIESEKVSSSVAVEQIPKN